jgi:hypothetical protein
MGLLKEVAYHFYKQAVATGLPCRGNLFVANVIKE